MPVTERRQRRFPRILLAIAIDILALALGDLAWAQDAHKQVLVLYSTRRDGEFSSIGERELPRILDIGLDRNLDYYSEFLDVTRFPDPAYQIAFADFLRLKYRGVGLDLVVALQDVAVQFVNRNRESLFGTTPEVFLSNDPTAPIGPNATGLIHERDFAGTLALIERLQPDVKNVFVVVGAAASDKAYERAMRIQAKSFEARVPLTYLAGLSTEELEQRLASLPDHSAVYHLLVAEDGAGHKYHPLEYVNRVAAVANAPTYSWVDSAMGRGIVGGSLYSQTEAIDRIGQLALRVLQGERADSIPRSAVNLNAAQVDWRQLHHWGIDEARVPAGTVIRFREPSVWDRYKTYILAAVALLIVQSGLIAGLLIQRVRRRRTEVDLRRSQDYLRTSYDRIRDLWSRLLRAQETERSRIARELHDDIGQQLAILTMDLDQIGGADRDDARRLATEAVVRAREIASDLHDLSHRLHPARLRLLGLVDSLQALRLELSQSGMAIVFTHDNVPSTLPSDLTLCLFRVAQEVLQNAIKYSKATKVSIHLDGRSNGVTLSIIDDGVGFDVDAVWHKGLGLVSMRERVEAVSGALEIRSTPGAGTQITATVPLDVAQSAKGIAPSIKPYSESPAARRA
jgi:signal transduction histidine kinase